MNTSLLKPLEKNHSATEPSDKNNVSEQVQL